MLDYHVLCLKCNNDEKGKKSYATCETPASRGWRLNEIKLLFKVYFAFPRKNSGRTDSFKVFLEHQVRLKKNLRVTTEAARRALRAAQECLPQVLVSLDEIDSEDVFEAARQWRERAEERADALRRGWAQEARSSAQRDQRLARLLEQIVRVQTSQMVRRTVSKLILALDLAPPAFVMRAEAHVTEPTEAEFYATLQSFVTLVKRQI